MVTINNKEACCGCNACGDICPRKAIVFVPDNEGFLYPQIDTERCIKCGLCNKICPIENHEAKLANSELKPECFVANHKHLDIRFDSTSGGAFTALAEAMLKNGGYVGGAVYTEDWHVKQIITDKIDDLPRLRSSKYIQSNALGYYSRAKELLEKGNRLLFVGLPCQVVALRNFLNKEYDNLILVELICRYINSPLAYEKYLKYLETEYDSEIVYIKPKNKELGWRELTHKVVFKNGKTYYGTIKKDKFMKASMGANCLSRPSCYECKFKGFPRNADITIGDYWVKEITSKLDDNTGTSIILLNTKKGKEYFGTAKKYLKVENADLEKVKEGNPALTDSLPRESVDRSIFYKRILDEPFDVVVDDLCGENYLSIKRKMKNIAYVLYKQLHYARFNIRAWGQFLYLNFFHPAVKSAIVNRKVIYITGNCVFEIHKKSSVELNGYLIVGVSPFRKSKLETRIKMGEGSRMIIGDYGPGGYAFGYGSDIELFNGAVLESKGGPSTNMNTTIICMNKIVIGQVVAIGRNVTIRDNNGGHLININGYIDARPVIIGEHVWLCEGSTVLAGVKIGDGTIVGAGSIVNKSLPAHVTASGNPVKIGTEGIEWKM